MEAIQPKYRLGKIFNKFLILDVVFYSFFRTEGLNYLFKGCNKFRKLLRENYKCAKFMSEDALDHIMELPFTISQLDLAGRFYVYFVYLGGDKLYTA
jgi:hypothetical protein